MARSSKAASRRSMSPMLATLIDAPFDDPEWIFETKWDGFRIIANVKPGRVMLRSRGGLNITRSYKKVADALGKARHAMVLDGELVALDRAGRSSFQLLQNAAEGKARLRYCVFDLLSLDGRDLRGQPLIERKRLLASVLPRSSLVHRSRHVRRDGIKAFRSARLHHLEGIMAKRADSRYRSGLRTRDWLKIKTSRRQEAVVAGFTPPAGARKYFGALVLALRDRGAWRYAGNVGTGFNAATLKSLHRRLIAMRATHAPFEKASRGTRRVTWVRPRLVCEIKFTEWTKDGQMRHPAFVGLRFDKAPSKVARERERSRSPGGRR
jgi:bifunctional non-homologous end joining protein LigD